MHDRIRSLIKKESKGWDWQYHLLPVIRNAEELAIKTDADREIVMLGALLHDIGRIRHGPENHEIIGAKEAQRILKDYGYPDEIIEKVVHIVRSHRGSGKEMPVTLEAKVVANADALAHFDVIPAMIQIALKDRSFEDAFTWLDQKIERDWEKKITLPEAKEMARAKYQAIRVLFDSMKQYLRKD